MDLLLNDTRLAIEIVGLSKHFGSLTAVDNLNLQISEGECFGFLGPNGAGKTTTLNMLTTLLKPSAGRVKICGFDLDSETTEIKRHIGLMPDNPTIYQSLTGRQFIYFVASLYGLKKTKIDLNKAEDRAHILIGLSVSVENLDKVIKILSEEIKGPSINSPDPSAFSKSRNTSSS